MAGQPVTNPIGKIFAALACDLRLRILDAVNDGVDDTAQLAARLGISSSAVAKATTPLLRVGLLERRPRNQWRGAPQVGRYELAVSDLAYGLLMLASGESAEHCCLRDEASLTSDEIEVGVPAESRVLVHPAEDPTPRPPVHGNALCPGQWARDHDCCRGCGTTDTRHAARGLCLTCYMRERRGLDLLPKAAGDPLPPAKPEPPLTPIRLRGKKAATARWARMDAASRHDVTARMRSLFEQSFYDRTPADLPEDVRLDLARRAREEHYAELGRRSGAARRAKRRQRAERG